MELAEKVRKAAEKGDEEQKRLTSARDLAFAKRREFAEHYRAACLALGEYFAAMDAATSATNRRGGRPEDVNALRALDLTFSPLALLDGLEPITGNGWNRSFPVAPYQKKFGG